MFEHCRDCKPPKRRPGCQDHCPDYIADKAKHNERKAADAKARGRSNGTAYAQRVDSMYTFYYFYRLPKFPHG